MVDALAFGRSLNAAGGNKPTIVVTLNDDLSRTVRETYGTIWANAAPWNARGEGADEDGPSEAAAGDAPSRVDVSNG